MPISRTLNQDFFKTWKGDMAYVLGFFAADGSMVKNGRGAHFIEFTITDQEVLLFIKTTVGSSHAIAKRKRNNPKWKIQYRLQIGSKEWFVDLSKLGFTQNKSASLGLPKVPRAFFGDFVRGYFDGDGCIHFKKYWSKERKRDVWVFTTGFTSGSRAFLEALHKRLLLKGLKGGHISKKERGFDLVFSRHDSLALYKLMYHTGQTTGFRLSRKYLAFGMAIKTLYGDEFLKNTQR